MQPIAFYHQHLEHVSRSFSFCIMQLHSPAREWVALSYLLCRIVDTIEDSNWPDKASQAQAFEDLKRFLKTPPTEQQCQAWRLCFPTELPLAEKKLLADLPLLLLDIQALPMPLQKKLLHTLTTMMDGMLHFLNHHKNNTTLSLPSLMTTNQYCFFVAGIIGELLTHMFTHLIPDFKWSDTLLMQSFHFGLFLQKINILKDQTTDEVAGRRYIASRHDLRESLIVNANEALHYLQSIPIVPGRPYRLFCAWALFIGLASLRWIDKSWQANDHYKIKNRETHYLINQIDQMIDDNHALGDLFRRYLPASSGESTSYSHPAEPKPTWFSTIYPYDFSSNEVAALGIGAR